MSDVPTVSAYDLANIVRLLLAELNTVQAQNERMIKLQIEMVKLLGKMTPPGW